MKKLLITFIILIFTASCTSTKKNSKVTTKKNQPLKAVKIKVIDKRYKNNPMVEAYDVNRDQKADMWKIYREITENDQKIKVLKRREIDLNFDGKVNYYKFYTSKGNIEKEYIDIDLDGIVDKIRFYKDNSLVREEEYKKNPLNKDFTINKKIPPSKKIIYSNKKISRIIIDRNGNGKLDEYLFFKNNKLIEIGFDEDYDEKIDIRIRPSKKTKKSKKIKENSENEQK